MPRSRWETHIEPFLIEIEGMARNGATDEMIAKSLGVAYSTFRKYVKEKAELADIMRKGKDHIDVQVENALLKRALGYTYTEVTKEKIKDTGQKQRHEEAQKLTESEWNLAQAYFGHTCCYCGKRAELTKDHLKPLKEGGTLSRDNVVPCCKTCNSSKKDREWLSWYQGQDFYNKERAGKICDYITFVAEIESTEPENQSGELGVTKEVTKEVAPDTTAQIFWLKNRRPDMWRDKQQVEHSGEISNKLSDIMDQIGGEGLEE